MVLAYEQIHVYVNQVFMVCSAQSIIVTILIIETPLCVQILEATVLLQTIAHAKLVTLAVCAKVLIVMAYLAQARQFAQVMVLVLQLIRVVVLQVKVLVIGVDQIARHVQWVILVPCVIPKLVTTC